MRIQKWRICGGLGSIIATTDAGNSWHHEEIKGQQGDMSIKRIEFGGYNTGLITCVYNYLLTNNSLLNVKEKK